MNLNAETIKASRPVLDQIEQDLGAPVRKFTHYWTWRCPLHADTDPSLVVYTDPTRGWWCYGCAQGGDLFNWFQAFHGKDFSEALKIISHDLESTSPEEVSRRSLEYRQYANWHAEQAERKRQQAMHLLNQARDHLRWANRLLDNAEALEFLEEKGIRPATAVAFRLGVCTEFYLGPAITIPWTVGDEIRNIQYRVLWGKGKERYRWDNRGGPVSIFNADTVKEGQGPLFIVEGAIKCMVLVQHGLDCVAIASKGGGWKRGWAPHFRKRPVYVMLDPDAYSLALKIAYDIGGGARAVQMLAKPDDLIVKHGWDGLALLNLAKMSVNNE